MHQRLSGLVAAPFTPFGADGRLEPGLIPALCDHLVANDVAAAFVCGTTGEGSSLTEDERMRVAETWIKAAGGRLRVIVHVGHPAVVTARALAAHAQSAGADAVSSCCPSFYPIQNAGDLAACAAATAAGAPDLPFYFYHIPAFTRLEVSMVEFLNVAGTRIPNLCGIKFTHHDFEEMVRLLRFEHGRYEILGGREQMMLAALASGARSAIGSNFNFAAPLYHSLRAAFGRGDLETARELQALGIELTLILRRFGGLPAMKAVMASLGLDCGPTRLPLRPLNTADTATLHAAWEEWRQRAARVISASNVAGAAAGRPTSGLPSVSNRVLSRDGAVPARS